MSLTVIVVLVTLLVTALAVNAPELVAGVTVTADVFAEVAVKLPV